MDRLQSFCCLKYQIKGVGAVHDDIMSRRGGKAELLWRFEAAKAGTMIIRR